LELHQFFFAELRKSESGYFGSDDSEGDDDEPTSYERTGEEWFVWASHLETVSKVLSIPLDNVTREPYVKFLFWLNYVRERNRKSDNSSIAGSN